MVSRLTVNTKTMDASLTALNNLVDTITRISKDASTEMGRRPHKIASIRTTFIHLRAYYGKVYFLAKYICDEEQYSIQAVEEGNAEGFQDFIGEVVGKVESCKKDLEVLIEYLETERQELLLQDGKVKERKKDAQSTKKCGIIVAIIGFVICIISIIVVWIVSSTNDPDHKEASTHNPDDRKKIEASNATVTVAVVGIVIGLAIASAGIFTCMKGQSAQSNNQDEEQEHYHIVFAIEQMKSFFSQIENKLHTANNRLKSTMNGFGVVQPRQQQSQGSRPTKSSLVQCIKDVTESARGLRDYCQEFKEANSLEHFISYHTNSDTALFM